MSPRTAFLPALAVGLLLGGCSDNGLTDVSLPAAPQAAQASNLVPITWTYHVAAVPGDNVVCVNSDGSPPFLAIAANYTVEGMMSHLGLLDTEASAARFTACRVNIVEGYPVTGEGDATGQLVGANGDALLITGVLTLSFADFSATGEWTITGGTGRFAGASGWIQTFEIPSADGSGSDGGGSGMITPPGMLRH